MIRLFLGSTGGTAAIEYTLIAALVAIVIIAALIGIGDRLSVLFS